jgi:hypothetical protein
MKCDNWHKRNCRCPSRPPCISPHRRPRLKSHRGRNQIATAIQTRSRNHNRTNGLTIADQSTRQTAGSKGQQTQHKRASESTHATRSTAKEHAHQQHAAHSTGAEQSTHATRRRAQLCSPGRRPTPCAALLPVPPARPRNAHPRLRKGWCCCCCCVVAVAIVIANQTHGELRRAVQSRPAADRCYRRIASPETGCAREGPNDPKAARKLLQPSADALE